MFESDNDMISWVAPLLISDGGPDVIIPEGFLDSWTGYAGSDYETACRIGDRAIVGEMPDRPIWVLGGTAGSVCVGNVGSDIVMLRIISAPEMFKLPERRSEIHAGDAGPVVISREAADGFVMSAACIGDSVYESDAVTIHYSQGSVLKSFRVVTLAGGDYLVYQLSNASAVGTHLRRWISEHAVPFEHKNGAF